MEVSRSSTPEAPPQDLWSSILDSVSSSRSTPSKQILLLGQPSTGKSTIAAALLQKTLGDAEKNEQLRTDFSLGYDFADVRDEGDEDTLARLSVYTVPSASSAYTALLPYFLPPRNAIPHTLVMIVLDWTRPWTFVEDLQLWLQWVETWTKGDDSRELDIVREESRERLQSYLQHYTEPTADPVPQNSTLSNTVLPLGPGTFTHNLAGIPIVVCCTKADLIDEGTDMAAGASGMGGMVKGKGGDWEERTDGIMQVLRTICLKYGASLFYTTPLPATLQVLRQHALHLLFAPPAPSPGMAGTEPSAPVRNIFPFHHKPNTLDRDRVVVPAGWDSWGKISVMRDGFDPKVWGEAWEKDTDPELLDPSAGGGAKKLFAALVPDQGAKPTPLPAFNNPVPEQAFLAKNYDENAKKPDRDPRGAFRNPADLAGASAGIVGPMGSSSFSLPNVERALTEMESGSGGGERAPPSQAGDAARNRLAAAAGTRGAAGITGGAGGSRPAPLSSSLGPGGAPAGVGRPPSSPQPPSTSPGAGAGGAGAANAAGGQTQHEVLQNFFQSLLNTRDRGGGAAATTTRPAKTNGTGASRSTTPVPAAAEGEEGSP